MKPNTLLISADGTYPGIVLEDTRLLEIWCRVKWYKWGYGSSDVMDGPERAEAMLPLVRTPEQIWKQFRALPPEYVADRSDEIEREIRSKASWVMAEATDGTYESQEDAIQSLVNYVLGLLK